MQNGHPAGSSSLIAYFAQSKVTPLLVVASIIMGVFAVWHIPREEEPQISVPMFDIFVSYPGASSEEVERRIVDLGERKLWEIPGVEYIYSTSAPDGALITVRFRVGENAEQSLIRLYTKVFANLDFLPKGASQPLIKTRSIDDVPVLCLTFSGQARTALELRAMAARIQTAVNAIPDVSDTAITGGRKRQFQVFLDPARLAERLISPGEVADLVRKSNVKYSAGRLETEPEYVNVEADGFFRCKEDLENLVVGSSGGGVVRLRDVARVVDGPDEEERSANIRFAGRDGGKPRGPFEAVTLSVSKRRGANASDICRRVLARVEGMKGAVIPPDVSCTVTRDYGATADEKSNELLFHMALAVIGVTLLIAIALGWRESIVVAVAIPTTLSLTLCLIYSIGFTLNRITLFALIFSIGILVDDPIVAVENIVRHLRIVRNRLRPVLDVTIEAVREVMSPLVLATFTVMAAILPMAFVSGLMGPYMRPIPIGAGAAMVFSMAVAFVVTPWAAWKILGRSRNALAGHGNRDENEGLLTRSYRWYMEPLIYNSRVRRGFIWTITILLLASIALVPLKLVKVKMLPFDNKNEFQVVLDMPEGTSFAKTTAVAEEIAACLAGVPEVRDIEVYVGASAPYNFNGLVRHYFLRSMPYQADLQVNLAGKHERKRQSHEIAKAVRPAIHEIVRRAGGRVQVAEVPPGPPVLSTLALEIYGPTLEGQRELAGRVEEILDKHPGVTDVTTFDRASEKLMRLKINAQKASLNGIAVRDIAATIAMALGGRGVDLAHIPAEPEPVDIVVRLPARQRAGMDAVLGITMLSRHGTRLPLRELVEVENTSKDRAIYHKNLMRVSYVLGDVAGEFESPVYAIMGLKEQIGTLSAGRPGQSSGGLRQYFSRQPETPDEWSLKWDGEWQITYEVFRDLGLAFAAVLILIYVLVVGWFRSFKVPWIIMLPIPLTLVGILPAHWLTGTFFTATSMIGMIAGAGIVVRNSIILADFIQIRLDEGLPIEEAVIDAGAKRFRPMLLTAAAVVVGAAVILFDPIFQGLALALMAGEIASTILSRTAVPVIYYMAMRGKAGPPAG